MTREHFHESLDRLELEILEMGELAGRAVTLAVDALVRRDDAQATQVIDGDDAIDAKYMGVEQQTLELLALQTPVASDLRLLSAILHINHHLERIGDQAVNVAKIYGAVRDLAGSETITSHLHEMADLTTEMLRTSLEAFRTRDLELCLKLPKMDDPVDRLNRNMHQEIAKFADDRERLEWGLHMNLVARNLERVGDNAVDVAEQVGFLLTGEFREFTDASHPRRVAPDAE